MKHHINVAQIYVVIPGCPRVNLVHTFPHISDTTILERQKWHREQFVHVPSGLYLSSCPVIFSFSLSQAGIDGLTGGKIDDTHARTHTQNKLLVCVNEHIHLYIHVTTCQFKYHRGEGVRVCVYECVWIRVARAPCLY